MMKSFSILSAGSLLLCLCVVAYKSPLIAQVTGGKQPASKTAAGTKTPSPEEAKAARAKEQADAARRARNARFAADLLVRTRITHSELRSIRADMSMSTKIGDRSFVADGTYVQGPDHKMRLELNMTLDSGVLVTKARLLQACDGSVLKTLRTIGKRHRLTRRDIKTILNAASSRGRDMHNALVTELGLGGISGILASLERTMVFESHRDDRSGKQLIRILEGTWNPTFRNHLQGLAANQRGIPEFVPDRVRVYVDSRFILRAVEYLKLNADTGEHHPMITIKFENIKLNPKTSAKDFQFEAPKEVYEEEITEVYLQQLTPRPKK